MNNNMNTNYYWIQTTLRYNYIESDGRRVKSLAVRVVIDRKYEYWTIMKFEY